jgi:NSS family neurotransmitter:Na+ symporter
MAERRSSIHGQWSSKFAFILAATGSAVGLGNIWKFPYITGDNGGGAFVMVYLLCILVIGIPIMMAEVMLGRRGRQSPINTMTTLAREAGASPYWRWIGWMGVVAGFLILSYYSVIAGWALAYVFRAASGAFNGVGSEEVQRMFSRLVSDPERLLAWHTIFMLMTTLVVARGVRGGLEKAVRILMPALFLILVILVGYAMNTGHFEQGLNYLFTPDFSRLSTDGVLIAMGHAFFTLSLGMGAIMVYGSYLPEKASIAGTTLTIALLDTLVAVLAALAIFPIVFANGLRPDARRHPVRYPVLRAAGVRRLDLGHLAHRTGGGLAGRKPRHPAHESRHAGRPADLGAGPADCVFLQYHAGRHAAGLHRGVPRQDLLRPVRLPDRQCHATARWPADRDLRRLGAEARGQRR